MRTPLAWKNLTSSFGKCVLAATGVGFAVVLMFMQIGFRNALIDNNVQILTLFDPRVAKLAIVSRARYNLSTEQRFSRQILLQASSLSDVRSVCAVNVERGTSKVKVEGKPARPIRSIGIELDHPAFFADAELYAELRSADMRRAGLVDTRSKSSYGFATTVGELRKQTIELNGKSLQIVGQFKLGTDFGNDGSILTSAALQADYFPWRSRTGDPEDVVDIGLLDVRISDIDELDRLAEKIESLAPDQIQVKRTSQFIAREKDFWAKATPIGKIFLIGTLMGLVVGAIICYQIQFTDISEHMPEFATLKAMGYGPSYFWSVILCQSLYLACLGFLPGLAASIGLYALLAESSGLIMSMTLDRIVLVWSLTLLMCLVSGSLAIRKLFTTDPASLF
ncbi:MAG: FtsX-like permease family protein [Planctomycetales bacterium]|nr:FtsX-like permease family protein [Planctomycetales bacterium]